MIRRTILENKIYNIQGHELKLKEVKLKQIEMIAALIGEIDFDDSIKGISDIIKVIRKQGVKGFMEIAFFNQNLSSIDWNEVSYKQFRSIVDDFFLLNETLKEDLLKLLNDFLPKLVGLLIAFKKDTI